MPANPEVVELRRHAIELNVAALRRHLVRGATLLAEGRGNLWSIRKKSNHMLKVIYGQMAALGADARPIRPYVRKNEKETVHAEASE